MINRSNQAKKAWKLLEDGHLEAAHKAFEKISSSEKNNDDVTYGHALSMHLLGNNEKSLTLFKKLYKNKKYKDNCDFLINYAVILSSLNEFDKAIDIANAALIIAPGNPEYLYKLAMLEKQARHYDAAIMHCNNCIKFDKSHIDGHFLLGEIYRDIANATPKGKSHPDFHKMMQQAVLYFKKSMMLDTVFNVNHATQLALALKDIDDIEGADYYFKKSEECEADNIENLINYTLFISEFRSLDEASLYFDKMFALAPDNPTVKGNYAHHLLLLKKYDEAWRWYLERQNCDWFISAHRRPFSCKKWQGEGLNTKTLFIAPEQGVGEQILFPSLLINLHEKYPKSRLILSIKKKLSPLIRRSLPFLEIYDDLIGNEDKFTNKGGVDFYCYMGDLPFFTHFLTGEGPNFVPPYLKADEEKTQKFKNILTKKHPNKIFIGLAWFSGSSSRRCLPLAAIKNIAPFDNVVLVSLQYAAPDNIADLIKAATGRDIEHFTDIDSFEDVDSVCALTSVMDYVITTSNTCQHIAGALNIRTIMLREVGYSWRESDNNGVSCFYQSLHIISQNVMHEWDGVIVEANDLLRKWMNVTDHIIAPPAPILSTDDKTFLKEKFSQISALVAQNHKKKQNLQRAEEISKILLEKYPHNSEVNYVHGTILTFQDKSEDAIHYFTKAIDLHKNKIVPRFLINRASAHEMVGNNDLAIQDLNAILQCEESLDNAKKQYSENALLTIAKIYRKQKQFDKAEEFYKKIHAMNPANHAAFSSWSLNHFENGEFKEAVIKAHKSIAIKQDNNVLAYQTLAKAHVSMGQFDQSIKVLENALSHDCKLDSIYSQLGISHLKMADYINAEACFREAVRLTPGHDGDIQKKADALYNLSIPLILQGRFKEAWPLMEYRINTKGFLQYGKKFVFDIPIYDFSMNDLHDKNIIMLKEQGLGDSVMFLTLIGGLLARGNKIELAMKEKMQPLIRAYLPEIGLNVPAADDVKRVKKFDYQMVLGSLPYFLQAFCGEKDQTAPKAWLADHDSKRARYLREKWEKKFGKDKKIIGIAWQSVNRDLHSGSTELNEWMPLFENENYVFVNLQYGDVNGQIDDFYCSHSIEIYIEDEIDIYADIMGNLDLIWACDFIVSTSNTIVDFAGAMGKECYVLLVKGAEWRWRARDDHVLFYQSVKPYRQKEVGKWQDVFTKLVNDLSKKGPKNTVKLIKNDGNIPPSDIIPAPHNIQWADVLIKGKKLYEQGQYQAAVEYFTPYLHDGDKHTFPPILYGIYGASLYKTSDKNHIRKSAINFIKQSVDGLIKQQASNDHIIHWLTLLCKHLENFRDYIGFAYFQKKIIKAKENRPNYKNTNEYFHDIFASATAHQRADMLDEAEEYYKLCKIHYKESNSFYSNLAMVYLAKGDLNKAEAYITRALQLTDNTTSLYHNYQFNHASIHLAAGNFEKGFNCYKHRLLGDNNFYILPFDMAYLPDFPDADLKNKHLFIASEQGIGEQLMFANLLQFLPKIERYQHIKLTVSVKKKLIPIMNKAYPSITFIDFESKDAHIYAKNHAVDYYCYLGDLPSLLKLFHGGVQGGIPWIASNHEMAKKIKNMLKDAHANYADKKFVGISWRTSHHNFRNLSLEDLKKISDKNPNIVFVNLQYGLNDDDLNNIKNFNIPFLNIGNIDYYNDIETLCDLMSACDMILTIDNITAHLAGAMGLNAWVMLPYSCDWRWRRRGNRMAWYPSIHLFRQLRPNCWDNIVDKVNEFLPLYFKSITGEWSRRDYNESVTKFNMLKKNGDFDKAFYQFEKLSAIMPGDVTVMQAGSALLRSHKYHGEACDILYILCKMTNDTFNALGLYGACLLESGRVDDANFILNQSLKAIEEEKEEDNKNDSVASSDWIKNNLALTHYDRREYNKAEKLFTSLKGKMGDNKGDYFYNLSNVLYCKKQYKKSWKLYENRFYTEKFKPFLRDYDIEKWDYSPPKGKKILLQSEQGVGEQIMFASLIRYLPLGGGQFYLSCKDKLYPLFDRAFCHSPLTVLSGAQGREANLSKEYGIDSYLPIGSLPDYIGLFDAPHNDPLTPYLLADDKQVMDYKNQLGNQIKGKKVIGLSWHTTTSYQRSIPFNQLIPLANIKDCVFINLQYGDISSEKKLWHELTDKDLIDIEGGNLYDDLDSLASLISLCDLVVTIDNSTAHLSGALGKKTLFLTHPYCDWRWRVNRDGMGGDAYSALPTSQWYESVKIIESEKNHDWDIAIQKVADIIAHD